jgi:uncharacterized RDD family membrane protein YckC
MEPTNKKVSLLRIVAATIYDSLLMLGVWFLVGSLALGIKFVFTGEVSSLNPAAGMILVILSTWLYFAMFWIYGGKTLGMSSWKLRIISQNGNQITIIQTIVRFLSNIFTVLFAGIPFFFRQINKNDKSLSDLLSKTSIISD